MTPYLRFERNEIGVEDDAPEPLLSVARTWRGWNPPTGTAWLGAMFLDQGRVLLTELTEYGLLLWAIGCLMIGKVLDYSIYIAKPLAAPGKSTTSGSANLVVS